MKNFQMAWSGALLALFLILACAAPASAQTTLGRVSGSVLDSSGAALPGATITLTNENTNQVQTTVAGDNGTYAFPQVPVGSYKVEFTLQGFKTASFTKVTIGVGQEYSLTPRLELGAMSEQVEVFAGASLVSTTSPEVSATILQKQVLDIPLANRDITNLIKLQAGVPAMTNRANTTINGGRPTWTTVTLDGINIQDNFIRTNSLDFLPNRPTSDNVAEFSITTSVSGADTAGGATTVRMITPSGTNRFSGSVFEFNRDAKFAANSFFNNAATPSVPKPDLSRHQFGGRLGGPVLRDKAFFFGYYEGFRQKTQPAQNLTIPANADLLDGVFRYVSPGETAVRSVNVIQLTGLPVDPEIRAEFLAKIPTASNVNNYDVGNSTTARILNTAGYRFSQTDVNDRDQYGFRGDYALTDRHRFEGVYSYFKEVDDRTDLDFVSPEPLVYTSSDVHRFSLAWRWLSSSNFQNELRGGANLAPAHFLTDWQFPSNLYTTALQITNPISGSNFAANGTAFQAQGRYTNTYQIGDSANLMLGSHQLLMGGSWQRNHVNPYNFAGQYPQVTFGFSSAAPAGLALTTDKFPGGISAAELANANIEAASQTYFSKSARSLNLRQAAMLAGLTQAPSAYDPVVAPEKAIARRDEVLRAMLEEGMITRAQHDWARASRSPGLRPGNLYKEIKEPYFFGYVRDELIRAYGVETVRSGGLRVYTTILPRWQKLAQRAIADVLTEPDDPAAAVISIDPRTGAIRAMAAVVPGRRNNQFNLLTQARRQSGSTFKTFVLTAAVDRKIDPLNTYYVSAPFTYAPTDDGSCEDETWWCVKTYDSSYYGWSSIRNATLRSDNSVFAQLTLDVTPKRVAEVARRMGVRTPLDVNGAYVPAMGLGSIAVSPLDMASAYATLAAGGVYARPTAIRRVVLPGGRQDTPPDGGSLAARAFSPTGSRGR